MEQVLVRSIALSILFLLSYAQDDPRPVFPDIFQAEVQGIFQRPDTRPRELDGSLYYDKLGNRAVLVFTYQKLTRKSIYNFNDNQILVIEGSECTVSEIPDNSGDSFFPFVDVKGSKKQLATPEDLFYFTNTSILEKETRSVFPSYIYKSTLDFPQRGRKNCEVMHIFSRPEFELPNCDDISCQPTLLSVSVKCPEIGDNSEVLHIYNLFRFRSSILGEEVFQAPVGIHCNATNHQMVPDLPVYYSFSYDVSEKQSYVNESSAVYTVHKKIWFDSQLKVIRLDEFDDDGLLISSRVFDFFRGTAYTIAAQGIATCEKGAIDTEGLQWDQMTRLPNLFFMSKASLESNAVYVGKRNLHGLDYEVWSSSRTDQETDAFVVEEFYYTNNIATILNESYKYFQIAHVDISFYERNGESDDFELSVLNHLSINHFRSKPKEWEAYDVASCYSGDQKKIFTLTVKGPPAIKGSHLYEEILELLYMKILQATKISVVRISELGGVFDGTEIKEFVGWILEKVSPSDSKNTELDMEEAYDAIQKAAESGSLNITITKDGKIFEYVIKGMNNNNDKNNTDENLPKPTFPGVFRVQMQGIFRGQNGDPPVELEGTIFYDGVNKKAAIVSVFQNVTTKTVYNFDTNEMLSIEGSKCKMSEISDDGSSLFSFAKAGSTGEMTLASPEELFFFTNSVLDRQDISISPFYIYEGKVDFPQIGLSKCDVSHAFSKPGVELATCEGHACKPTLATLSVRCQPTDDMDALDQVYNFFRFRTEVSERVFQAPVGVHCPVKSSKPFPPLPGYFSFSYDILKEQEMSGSDSGVYSLHKKIWYESKVNIVRMDEIDDDGLLTTTRIFDFYGGAGYTIISSLSACEVSSTSEEEGLDELTRLPQIFFTKDTKNAVYVGKRSTRGLDYEVWSIPITDDESYTYTVEEIYFTKNIPAKIETKNDFYFQLSHADIYTYVRNEDTKDFEMSLLTHLSINNFRSKKKEWESFDVSLCFSKEQRKGFRLTVKGPTIVKESYHYHDILEHLLMKLVNVSSVNVLRINELQGIFDGTEITEFAGWILEKPDYDGAKPNAEADAASAYSAIEKAVVSGQLTINVKTDNTEESEYSFPRIETITGNELPTSGRRGYSGASMSGMGLACLSLGLIIGVVGYYVFLKKRRRNQEHGGKVELVNM